MTAIRTSLRSADGTLWSRRNRKLYSEFEEKTFEKAFYSEVVRRHRVYYPPGQVEEGYLGFDDAFRLDGFDRFWRFRRIRVSHRWRMLGVSLEEIARSLSSKMRDYRGFQYNCFIQYKRPEFITSSKSKEWSYFTSKYYRYRINKKQQDILERVRVISGDRAIVCYAAPSFHTMSELIQNISRRRIVNRTNIVDVDRLSGHGKYAYSGPQDIGFAFSAVNEITPTDIFHEFERRQTLKEKDIYENYIDVFKIIESVMSENAQFSQQYVELMEILYRDLPITADLKTDIPIIKAVLSVEAFSLLTGCHVIFLGGYMSRDDEF